MTDIPASVDILIIGGGPAGLTLAAELCRRGLKPLVVDRLAAGGNTSRAAVVHARTLEVLEPLGATAQLLQRGIKVPIFRVRDRDEILVGIDFAHLPTPYPFTLMCPQNDTEAILLRQLEAHGGRVIRPAELTGLELSEHGAVAEIMSAGQSYRVATQWLVGCDGMHSLVREKAGIVFPGGNYAEDFVLADVRMDWPFGRDEVDLFFSPQGLGVVAPLPDERFRIVATVDAAPEAPDRDDVQRLLDARGPKASSARISEIIWSSRFRIQHRVAETPRAGRVLLCGDAAHVHSPAGGQGMNTGIQDAASLAEPLLTALHRNDTTELDAWALDRHKVAAGVVGLTDKMTRAATISSPFGRRFRNTAMAFVGRFPAVREAVASRLAELEHR